jgi:hypothetical protein
MRGPPKQKRAPAKGAFQKLRLQIGYRANALLATIFGAVFWSFEQRRWRLADLLDNERSSQ